ncbi:taurine catabolism dioxygenase TauD [Lophiostoma macrostomum CBS 122681]|uniref:Taurine catabolism dioxygenase TauD n=1 Tax=Lophiostoma macrostomum CBS 122681 TaxID=1314788 RepID=A0A6A6T8Y2_9PLEO|nr:taurine catabolism dioxygenase TauD [Lophiostoma macrostomum CBS 122681]
MSDYTLSPRDSLDSLRGNSTTSSILSAPDALAPPVAGPRAWEGKELDSSKYVTEFTTKDLEEIKVALIHLTIDQISREAVDKTTFHLSDELATKLAGISKRVHTEEGVEVLRGLQALKITDNQSIMVFVGLCSYIASLRATDSFANQTLSHVRDARNDEVKPGAEGLGLAGSKLPIAMDFHADRFSGDILAMHVRHDGGAGDGGDQYVASAQRIYNELYETEPGVLETMLAPNWPFEIKKNHHEPPVLEMGPVLFLSKGRPIFQIVKAPLVGTPALPRHHTMPDITEKQKHALEVVDELAHRFAAKLERQQGDIQLIHNLSILHARSAYGLASKAQPSKRHLYRLFLRDPENAWEKPQICRENFDDPFTVGRKGEIPVFDTDAYRKISGCESHG